MAKLTTTQIAAPSSHPITPANGNNIPAWQIPAQHINIDDDAKRDAARRADSPSSAPKTGAIAEIDVAIQSSKRPAPVTVEETELRDPTKFGIALSSINVLLYSVMSLTQWLGWGGFYAASSAPGRLVNDAVAVMAVNLMFGLLVIIGVFALKPMHFKPAARYPVIALVAAVAAAPRVLAMMAIYTTPSGPTFMLAEWASGFLAGTIAVTAGVLTAALVGRARRENQRWAKEAERAQQASDDLHTEEMRVRRMVADQLHGRLQYRLVTIAAGLDTDAARLDTTGHPECATVMRGFADQVDQVRDQEVRSLSHAVYPAGIELGAVTAIRAMVHRLPPQITASLQTGPLLTKAIEAGVTVMPLAERLITVFTIEEALTNALKHGHANQVAIELEVLERGGADQMVLVGTVDDDGRGFAPSSDGKGHSGLARHTERLTSRGGHLNLTPRPGGGTRLEFALPFTSLVAVDQLATL